MKNPTPRQVSFISALFISLITLSSIILTRLTFGINISWTLILFIFFVTFLFGYLILINSLEIFIYRKIKLIYKVIAKSKDTKDHTHSRIDMKKDILGHVEQEVLNTINAENTEIEQLKKMEIYRRQFLGNVSHELKTPIFHIQGYLETLIDGGIKDDTVNVKYLKQALKNADRLNSIVNDLEMISLIEDGRLNLEIEDFNLWELVNEVFDSFSMLAEKSNVMLKFKKGFINPCFVKADRERIRQVLSNLVVNAIKYNIPNGKITIGSYDMDEKILVEVSDTGIGIPKEHMSRIFERFYRVDTSRSREKGGTGLGLSIVKHILEAHSQSINVRSTLGEGTTFSFTLPKTKFSYSQTGRFVF